MTKQQRKTANRKARQQAAYRAWCNRSNIKRFMQATGRTIDDIPAFAFIPMTSKQLIVDAYTGYVRYNHRR